MQDGGPSRWLGVVLALAAMLVLAIGCGASGGESSSARSSTALAVGSALPASTAVRAPAAAPTSLLAPTALLTPAAPLAPAAASAPGAPAGARRPNIVFVLTDDLASNLVRFMPHVLSMERQGATFSNYFVTDSLCCPSRASILSGRFPHNTRVVGNGPPFGGYQVFHARGEEQRTFATQLQGAGYRTALMGKYLNGYRPLADGVPPGWNEWDVAGNGYPEYGYTLNSDGQVSNYGFAPQDYLTDVLSNKAVSFIDRSVAGSSPFMLELATFAPHAPFTPAVRDAQDFPGLKAPRGAAFGAATIAAPAWLKHFKPLDAGQVQTIDDGFRKRAQAVQAVDQMIGRIEAELAAKGVAKNTYIVFSSDNGLHMGEHRLMPGKQTAFDTDIRVPLVVVGPGVPAGATIADMAENIDLCPTFDQLAGARVPPSVDGHSLAALLHARPAAGWRKEVLVEHHGPDLIPGDPDLPTRGAGNPSSYEAIRAPASLYVEYVTGEREYYNLLADPFELHNIARHLSPVHAQTLHRTLRAIKLCHGASACWRAQHGAT
ncbi:MAG TPA: sulfatase [Solirubrobacteraceae bacterium]|nr:sulfatase [Solirubrobacteraceae bacterium]